MCPRLAFAFLLFLCGASVEGSLMGKGLQSKDYSLFFGTHHLHKSLFFQSSMEVEALSGIPGTQIVVEAASNIRVASPGPEMMLRRLLLEIATKIGSVSS
jgi:hypothetical protein